MSKLSSRIALFAAVTFLLAVSLPGIALAKQGNGRNNNTNTNAQGGGPPACRDLQDDVEVIQQTVTGLATTVNNLNATVASLSATVTAMNTTVANLSTTVNATNATVNATNATVLGLSADIDTINTSLVDLQATVDDIQATLEGTDGVGGLQVDVAVDEAACVSGATQCSSAIAANPTNQNPVALTVLVMRDGDPVTDLTASNFQLELDFAPGLAATDLVFCTAGDTGCGTGSFVVNSGSGGYQLWVSPTANWVAGSYTAQLKVTDTLGNSATELVKITIPSDVTTLTLRRRD
jgi:hypothetical protein